MAKTIKVYKQTFKKEPEKIRVMENGNLREMEIIQKKPIDKKEVLEVTQEYYDRYLKNDERYTLGKKEEVGGKVGG